jgi:cbb3-type cytochrome oxidase subunit 3
MSDIVSHLDLAVFPIIGMLLFLSVFVGVVLQVTSRKRRSELDGAALLPFADETTQTPRTEVRR